MAKRKSGMKRVDAVVPIMPASTASKSDIKRIQEQGVEQTLPSGLAVMVRPVRPEKLLQGGMLPDILTPIVIDMLYVRDLAKTNEALDKFISEPREQRAEVLEMLDAIDVVCAAALVDTDDMPLLNFVDRAFIFRLAFLPAEVMATFRTESLGNVEGVAESNNVP